MDKSTIINQIMEINQYASLIKYLKEQSLYNYMQDQLNNQQIDLNQYVAPNQMHLLKRDLIETIINSEL